MEDQRGGGARDKRRQGNGRDEAYLFALLRRNLRRGDIVVADRGFWSFANLAFLPMRGADMVVRLARLPTPAIPLRRLGGRYAKRIDPSTALRAPAGAKASASAKTIA